ncbi:hypothetical protein O988_02339 [Pseudogymnoascus sp. VKM F-3808]|nr:hypothetical protein O988_02339 [Pseudogymnoascus sp. VKM F-3808]
MSVSAVPSGGGSSSDAFAQQGTVDWTRLSASTVNFTIEVLGRLSKAGVEPLTVAMGQGIFSCFHLDPDGEKRFSDAIARLKAFSSYGNAMWFGFGVKHIVRTLSETEQGATCGAICACLSVSYDKFFCSKVLKALADQQRTPNSLMPSLSQWAALVNICSGAVLGSRFPQLVEVYSRLTQSYDNSRHKLYEPTSADALAKALLELSKVSSGTVRSVTFIGGVDCGWLAALAQWLLSLRVDILAADGSVLYSSRISVDPSYYPQVTIVLQLDQDSQVNTALFKKSVIVPPGGLFFNIRKEEFNGQSHSFTAGRSEWPTIIHDAFGAYFDLLLHQDVIRGFATLLCCGFSASNSDDNLCCIDPWGGPSTTSTERQLLHLSFAAKRLPELIPACDVAKKMISCNEISFYTHALSVLELHCSCPQCESTEDGSPGPTIETYSSSICLKWVALAIFEYIWTLSWLNIDENIYPSVNGLILLSRSQEDYGEDTLNTIKGRIFKEPLMPAIIRLFTGQVKVSEYSDRTVSARSKGGVCVYLPSLENPTSPPQEQLRASVVAGHIEWGSKVFSWVIDSGNERSEPLSDCLASTAAQAYGTHLELKLVVEETFDSEVLVADLWTLSKSTELSLHISHHTGHIPTPIVDSQLGYWFGATQIRLAILSHILASNCYSKSVELQTLSMNVPICWRGTCYKASGSLWIDGHNNQCYSPTSEEWVLISQSACCQEIVRGSYQLLYSIICSTMGTSKIRLSSAACLVCLLGKHRNLSRKPPVTGPENNADAEFPRQARNLDYVVVHSFVHRETWSRVLLTSGIIPPAWPTQQPPSRPHFFIMADDVRC